MRNRQDLVRRRKNYRRNILIILSAAILAVLTILFFVSILPGIRFQSAMKNLENGNYEQAEKEFTALGEYRGAFTYAADCRYRKAEALQENGDHEQAALLFESLGDHRDSVSRAAQARADILYHQGRLDEAYESYARLGENYRSHTPSPSPIPTFTPSPTALPVTPSPTQTAVPTVRPTEAPTEAPTLAPTVKPTAAPVPLPAIGSHLLYGSYEQDGNPRTVPEPISWTVLAAEEDRVLLISDKVLDACVFGEGKKFPGWEESRMRFWLNDLFFNTAFSGEEQSFILPGTASGDRVFLLNLSEAEKFFPALKDRKAPATYYARMNGVLSDGSGEYWLCADLKKDADGRRVGTDGRIALTQANDPDVGVRPVIWLSIEAIGR